MMNLGDALHSQAQRIPQKTALFCGESRISYQALDELTTALAKWFLDQGLQPGDRVAIHWTNSIQTVQLLYSVFKAGLTAVTINTRLKAPEIEFMLNHAQVRMCFTEAVLLPSAEQAGGGCTILSELPVLPTAEADPRALPPVDPDEPALLIYTSGTTARPKGVVHTHRSLYSTVVITVRAIGPRELEEGVALCVLPLMHMGALAGLFSTVCLGGTTVLLPRFDPAGVLEAIEEFRCTSLTCLPSLWHFIVDEQARKPRRVSSLNAACAAGDAVPVALQTRFEAVFGLPLQEGYGMTESVPLVINPKGAIRSGSMGVPVEHVALRIVDVAGVDVPEGETGEILVRSPANCIGYWNDPGATRAAIEAGWLHTGDLASCDSDGYYWFRGRKKEIIIRAGSNISPQEVEEALYRHPAVLEAGVVGQGDSVYGEIVVAFVVLREGFRAEASELREFAQKHLADYKVPEKFVFLAEMPKSPVGKVHRRALRGMLVSASAMAV
uniref:AMP-dependent synthetase and ligase n=1 Tax=Solibacter usitatus (strain Ellin6076) TaxID=234267 RepID=Q029G6_SOLUE